ncbi:MAG TPA: serine/threonine-protein kinase [Ktedonobacterales bacterium]|nr:serine/threonine-protein kinase [Ktedonobacterales bacterium]
MIPSFAQPSSIGQRYKVIQRLGGGAMGAVFLAFDEQRQERVAIKVPAASRHWRAEYERRVLKEIGILSALQHPNIIAIQDWGQDPQLGPYIVMEYIEGGSVLQLMAQYPGNRLDPYEALRIGAAVADALAYAHSRQPPIIHRDIKPDNILVRRADGQVKVSDFGLAAVLTSYKRAMTQWGTPDYIAPEQALGKGADGRSDMYGLAATLYHMLTGLRPPSLGLPLPARPSAALTPGVLDAVQARRVDFLIITMMAYDPNDRRPAPDRKAWHATDVAEELKAIAQRRPAQVYPAPEDSAIFPSLMTGMIPPAGAMPPQRGGLPRPQPMPQQPVPPMPSPQRVPAPPPQIQARQPAPQMSPPQPVPPPRPLQAEQIPPPPAAQAAFGALPAPLPQVPLAPGQAHQPSGMLPPPAVPVPIPHAQPRLTVGLPNLAPSPAVQAAPTQRPPTPPQSAAPAAPAKPGRRLPGLSPAEKELIAGVLVGIAGAAGLFFAVEHLPRPQGLDTIFDALVFGLILWGTGLLVGAASPRGRRGRLPWLALLVAILTVAVSLPLTEAILGKEGIYNLATFAGLLIASPFIFL